MTPIRNDFNAFSDTKFTPEQTYKIGTSDAECAELCGLKPHQFYNWRRKNNLPALRAPGHQTTKHRRSRP